MWTPETGDPLAPPFQGKILCSQRSCFSVDYHNVLDVHRTSWRSASRYWDSVGEPCVKAIQKLAVYFNTIVCSYCHSQHRVNRVIEACLNKLAHPTNKQLNPKLVVITRHACGEFGKLRVLQALIHPVNSVAFHVDDGVHILSEFVTPGRQWSCVAIRHKKHLRFRGRLRLSVGICLKLHQGLTPKSRLSETIQRGEKRICVLHCQGRIRIQIK